MRVHKKIPLEPGHCIKEKLLQWSTQFREVVWLDSNTHNLQHSNYDAVLAVDAFTILQTDTFEAFDKLKEYQALTKDWLFGYLSYDLKNDTEYLTSQNFDGLNFPELYFFQPKKVFLLKDNVLELQYLNFVDDELEYDYKDILAEQIIIDNPSSTEVDIKIKLRMTKDSYFEKFDTIHKHICRGDIYEVNFCQEFYAEHTEINPLKVYQKLNTISNSPFATFLKLEDKYILSAKMSL